MRIYTRFKRLDVFELANYADRQWFVFLNPTALRQHDRVKKMVWWKISTDEERNEGFGKLMASTKS